MTESRPPFDEYVDSVAPITGSYDLSLVFRRNLYSLSEPEPGTAALSAEPEMVGVLRMTLPHAKAMAYLLRRAILYHEQELDVDIAVPKRFIEQRNINTDNWDAFWAVPLDPRSNGE